MPHVLLLDYSTDRSLGPATARWLPDVPLHTWTMVDGLPLPSLEGFSHLLHTGSVLSIVDDSPFVEGAMALVRDGVARGLPQLGICFGHQLLARALGGKAAVRRCPGGPEIGWLPVTLSPEGQRLLEAPARCVVWQYHFDEVVVPPPGARVLAASPGCAVQAMYDPARLLLGFQFHPEVDLAMGNAVFLTQQEPLAALGLDAARLVQGHPEGLDLRALMARFVSAALSLG